MPEINSRYLPQLIFSFLKLINYWLIATGLSLNLELVDLLAFFFFLMCKLRRSSLVLHVCRARSSPTWPPPKVTDLVFICGIWQGFNFTLCYALIQLYQYHLLIDFAPCSWYLCGKSTDTEHVGYFWALCSVLLVRMPNFAPEPCWLVSYSIIFKYCLCWHWDLLCFQFKPFPFRLI